MVGHCCELELEPIPSGIDLTTEVSAPCCVSLQSSSATMNNVSGQWAVLSMYGRMTSCAIAQHTSCRDTHNRQDRHKRDPPTLQNHRHVSCSIEVATLCKGYVGGQDRDAGNAHGQHRHQHAAKGCSFLVFDNKKWLRMKGKQHDRYPSSHKTQRHLSSIGAPPSR